MNCNFLFLPLSSSPSFAYLSFPLLPRPSLFLPFFISPSFFACLSFALLPCSFSSFFLSFLFPSSFLSFLGFSFFLTKIGLLWNIFCFFGKYKFRSLVVLSFQLLLCLGCVFPVPEFHMPKILGGSWACSA